MKTAMVTGSTEWIGLECVKRFACNVHTFGSRCHSSCSVLEEIYRAGLAG